MNAKPFALALLAAVLTVTCASTPAPVASRSQLAAAVAKRRVLPGYIRGNRQTRASRIIIFVHGIFGDGTSTWTNPTTRAYFPELVANDPTFGGADVWVHEFDTPKLRTTYTIDELADQLRKHLNNDNVVANHEEIVFVCHSMGGLVARAYLLKYHQEVPPEKVRMLYFFSTPTTGSDIASMARLVSSNPTLTDMRKMTTDDQGVLGVWDAQWSSSAYVQETLSYCAYELLPTFGIQVVERESARHLCNTRPDPIARNHIEIVKPANSTNDESYIAFREAWRDTYERRDAPAAGGRPTWNLTSQDAALLRVRNLTQTPNCATECWSSTAVVAPGDVVQLVMNYRNRGFATTRDARVRLDVPVGPIVGMPVDARLWSDDSQPVFGRVLISALVPVLLKPVQGWLYDGFGDQWQDLPYQQTATSALSKDGLRLGDVDPDQDQDQVVLQFRCEPATLIALDAESTGNQVMEAMKKIQEGTLTAAEMGAPIARAIGHVDTGDVGEILRWVSEVNDLHDDSAVLLQILHYNSTAAVQRQLRARIRIVDESDAGATVIVGIRSADIEEREYKARLNFRPGTKHRPSIIEAFFTPKNLLKVMRVLKMPEKFEEDSIVESVPTSRPDELDLGDLAPQSAVVVSLACEMLEPEQRETLEQEREAATTILNGHPNGPPLIQLSRSENKNRWRDNIADLVPGDPLALSVYFHNTGKSIARGVRVRLALDAAGNGFTARGTMTAANAQRVSGESRLELARPAPRVRLYYDNAWLYRDDDENARIIDAANMLADGFLVGDLDPDEWGWLVVRFRTSSPGGSDDACASKLVQAGTPVEHLITVDNDSANTLRHVHVQLDFAYRGATFVQTATATAGARPLFTRQQKWFRKEGYEQLRYREATLYQSMFGKPIDAHDADSEGVSIGDIPPGGQALLRIRYDVVRAK